MATYKTKEGYHEGTIKSPSGKEFKITKPTLMKKIGSGIKKAAADREEDEYMKNKAKSEAIKSKMK